MASGTGNLPNQGMDFTPFDVLTAEEMDDLVENIESLADGTGIGDGSVTTNTLAQSAVTLEKTDLATFESTANLSNAGGFSGTIVFSKFGNLVTVSGSISGTIPSGNTLIGTIPAGFRPAVETAISSLFNGAATGTGVAEAGGNFYVSQAGSNRSSVTVGGSWKV